MQVFIFKVNNHSAATFKVENQVFCAGFHQNR
jgi:hypothetical protein